MGCFIIKCSRGQRGETGRCCSEEFRFIQVKMSFFKRLSLQNIHTQMDVRTGPEGAPRESSVGWRWALPESRLSPAQCHKSPDICPAALQPKDNTGKERRKNPVFIDDLLQRLYALTKQGDVPGTLSLRKPILRMFSTLGAPSAMLRSPRESPIRMMLEYSFSCLKYSVFLRAPSCLLYTWISSPLKPLMTP